MAWKRINSWSTRGSVIAMLTLMRKRRGRLTEKAHRKAPIFATKAAPRGPAGRGKQAQRGVKSMRAAATVHGPKSSNARRNHPRRPKQFRSDSPAILGRCTPQKRQNRATKTVYALVSRLSYGGGPPAGCRPRAGPPVQWRDEDQGFARPAAASPRIAGGKRRDGRTSQRVGRRCDQ